MAPELVHPRRAGTIPVPVKPDASALLVIERIELRRLKVALSTAPPPMTSRTADAIAEAPPPEERASFLSGAKMCESVEGLQTRRHQSN